ATRQPSRHTGHHAGPGAADRDRRKQLLERHRRPPLARVPAPQLLLRAAHRVHDHEPGLGASAGADKLEVVTPDDPDAAALHLLEQVAAAYLPQEHHHLERLDVGPRGDHVYRDGDTGVVRVAER